MNLAEVRAALDLYHIQHADECNCEACNAYDDATDEVEHPVDGVIVTPESLATALHAASDTGFVKLPLCSLPHDQTYPPHICELLAAAILAALAAEGEQAPSEKEPRFFRAPCVHCGDTGHAALFHSPLAAEGGET